MTPLRAFIGHSFNEVDANVVRVFLNFMNHVSDMNVGFSWEHAEAAEAKDLAAKVLRLMEDKNLFIGICTKKQVTILPSNLKKVFYSNHILKVNPDALTWKTSDWIIQEIGLAIGLKMDLILLIEEGIEKPGGLQGDLEYVVFDRAAPEKAFGKILEMIKSLTPRTKSISGQEATLPSSTDSEPKSEQGQEDSFQPSPSWSKSNFDYAFWHMVFIDDQQGATRISKAYLETEEGKENKVSWEAYEEHTRLSLGKGGQLAKLIGLANNNPDNPEVHRYLAKGYEEYKEHDKAGHCFEMASEKAQPLKRTLILQGDAARAFAHAGRRKEVSRLIAIMKTTAPPVDGGEVILVKTLRDIAEIDQEKDLLLGLSEKLLELCPSDSAARFSLAYNYGQAGHNELSLYHYLKIPFHERDAAAWNNLGFQYGGLDLNSKSVRAYRRAESLGETLAMSNIAHNLAAAGFLPEAEEICNRALKIKDYHKNIGGVITRMKAIQEEEDEKENDNLKKAEPALEFYKAFGHAATKALPGSSSAVWQGPDCALNISFNGNSFEAEGTFERVFAAGLFGFAIGSTPTKETYKVRYSGVLVGQAIKAIRTEVGEGDHSASTILTGDTEKKTPVLMYLLDAQNEIGVYDKKATKSFYKLALIT